MAADRWVRGVPGVILVRDLRRLIAWYGIFSIFAERRQSDGYQRGCCALDCSSVGGEAVLADGAVLPVATSW